LVALSITTFAGNVPDIDILAYRNGRTITLQVNSVRSGSVSFDAKRFLTITFDDNRQIITGQALAGNGALIFVFVFVSIGQGVGDDRFFILEQRELRRCQQTVLVPSLFFLASGVCSEAPGISGGPPCPASIQPSSVSSSPD
jgi:hypothetical protein